MKDPLKPRDKITQKMTRDGAITENQTTGETERISKRTQDAELQKTPEQQAAQDAAQLQGAASPTSPLPHVPGAAPKADTGKTERVMEHIEAAHTRKASKKAVRKAQAEATAGTKSSRLQFTDEERAAPELEKYIKKSDKAADRFDKAKAAIPKEKKLVKERTFDETTGKGKTRLHFEEKDKPPGFKEKHNPLSRPTQEAGILVHNKIHSVEKDNSGVEGAHKSEEAAERGKRLFEGCRKMICGVLRILVHLLQDRRVFPVVDFDFIADFPEVDHDTLPLCFRLRAKRQSEFFCNHRGRMLYFEETT